MTKISKDSSLTVSHYTLRPEPEEGPWTIEGARAAITEVQLMVHTYGGNANRGAKAEAFVRPLLYSVGRKGELGEQIVDEKAAVRFASKAFGFKAKRGQSVHTSPEAVAWVLERINPNAPLATILKSALS